MSASLAPAARIFALLAAGRAALPRRVTPGALHLATCAVFLSLIFAPVLAIYAFGVAPSSQGNPLMMDLLKPRLAPRSATDPQKGLAAEILERSQLRETLIGVRSWLAYNVAGYVDTPLVVSGRDGWLFYKEEFWGGRCLEDRVWTTLLNEMDLLTGIAKPTGMRLFFTVAPDKSALYPEQLDPRSAIYWKCKAQNSARWRALAAERAPGLIDHKTALDAVKAAGVPLYFQTDTHWNLYGGAVAIRQLAAATLEIPSRELPEAVPLPEAYRHPSDMRRMLKLAGTDLSPLPNNADDTRFVARAAIDARTTAIIHDSFYFYVAPLIEAVFKGTNRFHMRKVEGLDNVVLRNPSLLIVESVERSLPLRFGDGPYGVNGALGQAIIANNRKAANRCIFGKENMADALADEQMHELSRSGRKFVSSGVDPWVVLDLPEGGSGSPCLRLSVTVKAPTRLEIFLPPRKGRIAADMFEAGRVLPIPLAAGENHIKLVLPDDLVVRKIRIDPVIGIRRFVIDDIAFGYDSGVEQLEYPAAAFTSALPYQ
ncbi:MULTISPECIES: hypothetical protein [Rhodomicrobium]|uniref:alginate O-acetyltransferase AlgX-related protein n=1 Tax=Rhodomicrobium TaxID=1068 RepID=UPI000B4A7F13|nr:MULTISPECIES: hypothetical protein [Rhodomicrobium]